ncbi:guanine deaminase [Ascodesmis nigricans]|uniref:Guanine deaminase n=1 Tax=Ascodesmis nigricans TaxID=341454 RepID=A0A4S2MZA8_9PEZI|nr:guanine deaminase [Ascodesmis nigricans]
MLRSSLTSAAAMSRNLVLTGTFIHTPSKTKLEVLTNTAVFVENGVITSIMPATSSLPSTHHHIASPEGSFFFPGFIDTHIHASQYPNSGIFGTSTLLDWLKKYTFPLERSLADPVKARQVYSRVLQRTLANGTTTASYFATIDVDTTNLLADLALETGQRAFIGRNCMDQESPADYVDPTPEASVERTQRVVEHCRKIDPEGKLIRPIVTPRFAPTCSAKSLRGLGDLAEKEDLHIQTHLSENKPECEWVAQLFEGSKSYAHVYDDAKLLTPKTVLAHVVHVSDEEVKLLAERKSGVAHCPVSNNALGSGCCGVKRLMRAGVKVGLGTDVSGGYSCSVLENVRQATLVSSLVALQDGSKGEEEKLTFIEALWLATRGGAEVMGLEDKVGGFEVGKEFDAQLVGLGTVEGKVKDSAVDVFGWEDWEEKTAKWVYRGDERNTLKVWVAGREVYSK